MEPKNKFKITIKKNVEQGIFLKSSDMSVCEYQCRLSGSPSAYSGREKNVYSWQKTNFGQPLDSYFIEQAAPNSMKRETWEF